MTVTTSSVKAVELTELYVMGSTRPVSLSLYRRNVARLNT